MGYSWHFSLCYSMLDEPQSVVVNTKMFKWCNSCSHVCNWCIIRTFTFHFLKTCLEWNVFSIDLPYLTTVFYPTQNYYIKFKCGRQKNNYIFLKLSSEKKSHQGRLRLRHSWTLWISKQVTSHTLHQIYLEDYGRDKISLILTRRNENSDQKIIMFT